MKLNDIEKNLPNGFHDALLKKITIDYTKREAILDLSIWMGDVSSKDRELREKYREGKLRLFGLIFCIIEPPDPKSSYSESTYLRVNAGPVDSAKISTCVQLPESLPEGAFAYWFFVNQWNSFIYLAVTDAQFDWT